MPTVDVAGVRIHSLENDPLLQRLEAMLSCGKTHVINHLPADPIVIANRSPIFRRELNEADVNVADGFGVVWAARLSGASIRDRAYGPDFLRLVSNWGLERGLRHYFYGGDPSTANALVERLVEANPGMVVSGSESPPFREISESEFQATVQRINHAKPDVLWVGVGTPKQQTLAVRLKEEVRVPAIVTVGAAFDFISERKRQAPAWMRGAGLEWFFRLLSEPGRLWKRYILGNPKFVAVVVRHERRRRRRMLLGEDEGTGRAVRGSVVIAGPDGSGKSTLARNLAEVAAAEGIEVVKAHHRPMILPSESKLSSSAESSEHHMPMDPHAEPPRMLATSLLKLAWIMTDYLIGSATAWRKAKRNGLLIVERGWWDMIIDPARYRLHPRSVSAVRPLGRFIPRADLGVLLEGDSRSFYSRKGELSVKELDAQMKRLLESGSRFGRTTKWVDATKLSQEEVLHQVWLALKFDLGWRSLPLLPPRLEALQWGRDRSSVHVYRPHRAVAKLAKSAAQSGGIATRGRRVRPPFGVSEILSTIGVSPSGLTFIKSSAGGRWILGVAHRGDLAYVVKVGELQDDRLQNEAKFLSFIQPSSSLAVPELAWAGEVGTHFVLATVAVAGDPSAVSVEDAARIASTLTAGIEGQGPVVHGDLARWNLMKSGRRVVAVDWEMWRPTRQPLWDLSHFVVQDASLLGTYTPKQAVDLLTARDSTGWRHLEELSIDPSTAPTLLKDYLVDTLAVSHSHLAKKGRQEMLRILK